MHRSARTLTRYASDSPRPLKWYRKKKLRFVDEVDTWEGWDEGYGVQWGFDGHGGWIEGVTDARLLDISKKILWLLDQCGELLVGIDVDTPGASIVREQFCKANVHQVEEDDILDVIELYT